MPQINNLHATVADKPILKGLSLVCLLMFAYGSSAAAQASPKEDSFAIYQSCFDKAATELFAAGNNKAARLEKAARKRCKAERDAAIIDEQVRFMMDSRLMAMTNRADMIRAMDRVVAKPVMKRLGFEGY